MSNPDLQPLRDWLRARVVEAQRDRDEWGQLYARSPDALDSSMSAFRAGAALQVYQGLVELYAAPTSRATIADLRAHASARVIRASRNPVPNRDPANEIFDRCVCAAWADLAEALDELYPKEQP